MRYQLSKLNVKTLATRKIAASLLNIMKTHIGSENAITRRALFYKIFKKKEDANSLEDYLRWDFAKKAMHLCRRKTKCFIASRYVNKSWVYFVVADDYDADFYVETLERNIKAMRAMQRKVRKSVRENWSQLNWMNDVKSIN